jgi:hypothetical protein
LQKTVVREGEKQTLLRRNKRKNSCYLFLERLLTAWSVSSWEFSGLLDGQAFNSVSCGVYYRDLKISRKRGKKATNKQMVLCGNFCLLFYDALIYQHYRASVRNECYTSLNCYILVRPVVLCYIGNK